MKCVPGGFACNRLITAVNRTTTRPPAGVRFCRLYSFFAKDTQRNAAFAIPDLLCDVWKQQVAGLREKATQLLQSGGASIPAPLSGSLN